MMVSLYFVILFLSFFLIQIKKTPTLIYKQDFCPIFQRKCPDCKKTETCIYPNSGGCEGAGIPVCKPRNCHRVLCLARNIPW